MSKTPDPFDKEAIYDAEIAPLMERIIDICKIHQIPMFASFCYAIGSNPDDRSYCTTNVPIGDWQTPEYRECYRAVYSGRGQSAAFTITTQSHE